MKEEVEEMRKEAHDLPSRVSNSGRLDEAIKSVYERYGTDLSAFFRDAYEQVAREEQPSACGEVETHT